MPGVFFVGHEVFSECFFKPDHFKTEIESFTVSSGILLDVSSALSGTVYAILPSNTHFHGALFSSDLIIFFASGAVFSNGGSC